MNDLKCCGAGIAWSLGVGEVLGVGVEWVGHLLNCCAPESEIFDTGY